MIEFHGFLNLNKSAGMTSMDAVRRVKRITGQRRKVGHGGTMDPLARGVLPICFGQAARLMGYLLLGSKRYVTEIKLGISTSTYDAEGEVTGTGDFRGITQQEVEATLQKFVGLIDQTPPMYSALKVNGQRLYKLARAGIQVERRPRPVEIHNIMLVEFSPPNLVLEVESGRGVYIRSLAHDVGESLGCGGHVSDLERLSYGHFQVKDGVTLEQLEQANAESPEGWLKHLYPVDWVLSHLQSISVPPPAEKYLRNGQAVNLGQPGMGIGYLEQFRAYSNDGRFLALVQFERASNAWKPVKVFHATSFSPNAPGPRGPD